MDAKKATGLKVRLGKNREETFIKSYYIHNIMKLERVLEDTTTHDWLVLTHLVDLCSQSHVEEG